MTVTHTPGIDNPAPASEGIRPRKALTLDLAAYAPFLESADIPEAEKTALLEALWQVIVGFVDLGFDIHPVQQVCGQNAAQEAKKPPAMVGSARSLPNETFEKAAARSSAGHRDARDS